MAAVQALIDGSLGGYVTNIIFKPFSDQVNANTLAITALQGQISSLPTAAVLNGYAKIADLTSSEFLTSGAGSLTKATRNVYTIKEIDDKGFATQSAIPDVSNFITSEYLTTNNFITSDYLTTNNYVTNSALNNYVTNSTLNNYATTASLNNYVLTSVFAPVSAQVTTNTGAISILQGQIGTINATLGGLDLTQLQNIINSLNGVDVTSFITKNALQAAQIINIDGSGNITKNVYTIEEIDNKKFATQSSIPDVSNFITSSALTGFLTSASLSGYATIKALKDARFLTSESLSDGERNIYTKLEVDNKITSALSGVTPTIDTSSFALKTDLNSIVDEVKGFASTETKNIEYLMCVITDLLLDKPLNNCVMKP